MKSLPSFLGLRSPPSPSAVPASHAQTARRAGVTEHIAIATKAAKTDLLGPLGLCKTATPPNGPDFMASYNAHAEEAAAASRCR